jgi:hypothetical protein
MDHAPLPASVVIVVCAAPSVSKTANSLTIPMHPALVYVSMSFSGSVLLDFVNSTLLQACVWRTGADF